MQNSMKFIFLMTSGGILLGGCAGASIENIVPDPVGPDPVAADPSNPPASAPNANVRTGKGHFIVTAGAGGTSHIIDRSNKASDVTITTRPANGPATSADIAVAGALAGGTAVPGVQGMLPDNQVGESAVFVRRRAEGVGDTFLALPTEREGKDHTLFLYGSVTGQDISQSNLLNSGYVVVGNRTSNMPTSGTATYTGQARATLFVHGLGNRLTSTIQDVRGNTEVTATFNPTGGSVGGRMKDMRVIASGSQRVDRQFPADIVINPASITGSTYQGGTLRLVQPGTNMPVGTTTSSDYQGAFYGSGAAETSGTFQFSATGVPIPSVGTDQNLQVIGGFSASR